MVIWKVYEGKRPRQRCTGVTPGKHHEGTTKWEDHGENGGLSVLSQRCSPETSGPHPRAYTRKPVAVARSPGMARGGSLPTSTLERRRGWGDQWPRPAGTRVEAAHQHAPLLQGSAMRVDQKPRWTSRRMARSSASMLAGSVAFYPEKTRDQTERNCPRRSRGSGAKAGKIHLAAARVFR